ncbi:MAG TPA: septum formation initiator family protein [Gammaproteobacteria bacterium]|nr:septum formation initiator family protein [Gammaproteobacteria bacterium]
MNSQLSKGIIIVIAIQVMGIVAMQSRMWNDNGIHRYRQLKHFLFLQNEKKVELLYHNEKMEKEIQYLQSDQAIEEYAREKLGMLGKGETYYQIKDE